MIEKWLEFRVGEECKHEPDIYDGCPICLNEELEAAIVVYDRERTKLQEQVAELEALVKRLDQ